MFSLLAILVIVLAVGVVVPTICDIAVQQKQAAMTVVIPKRVAGDRGRSREGHDILARTSSNTGPRIVTTCRHSTLRPDDSETVESFSSKRADVPDFSAVSSGPLQV